MRVFGSDCYLHVPDEHRGSKLDAKARRGIFVGYAANGGWRVLDLSSGKVVASRDVKFNENEFTFRGAELARALGVEAAHDYEPIADDALDDVLAGLSFKDQMTLAMQISKDGEEQRKKAPPPPPPQQQQQQAPPAPPQPSDPPVSSARAAAAGQAVRFTLAGVPVAGSGSSADPPAPAPASAAAPAEQPAAHAQAQAPVPAPAVGRSGRPQRTHTKPDRLTLAFVVAERAVDAHAPLSRGAAVDPESFAEAMSRPDAAEWKAAADAEMASHARNGTWVLVEMPQHRRPVGCKWVFKTKYRADGTVDKKKGRLVAKGFTQQYGIDFLNTWSPAVRAKTLRLVIILATRWDMEIEQLDVETAFLNARMNEEVYMQLPEGYEQQLTQQAALGTGVSAAVARAGGPLVCRLVMCLFGTKQASMEWNREVNRTLTGKLGFARSVCDPCLYHRVSRTGRPILLCLFVDDLVSAHHASDGAEWRQLKALFTSTYRCKDGGAIYSLLGMRLLRIGGVRADGLRASQALRERGRHAALRGHVHAPGYVVRRQPAGATSAFGATSEYMALSAVIAELQWLHQLLAEIGLRDDADADQHADDDGTDAGNGGAHAHGSARGGPSTVATGASGSSRPVPPLGQRCAGGRCSTCTTLVRSDNQSAISQVTGQSDYHARSKHIDIRHHFVKAASQRGEVQLQWVQSAEQLADVFTKPLDAPTFARLRDEIMGGGQAQQGDAATTTATTTKAKTRAADVAMLARETDADDDGSGSSAPAGPQGACTRPRCSPPGARESRPSREQSPPQRTSARRCASTAPAPRPSPPPSPWCPRPPSWSRRPSRAENIRSAIRIHPAAKSPRWTSSPPPHPGTTWCRRW